MWCYLLTPILCLHSSRLHGWVIAGWFWDMQGGWGKLWSRSRKRKKRAVWIHSKWVSHSTKFKTDFLLRWCLDLLGQLGWPPDSLLAGVGCPWLAVWSTVGTAACSARPASFVVTVAVSLELFDFCSGFFPSSQAICSEFLLETEPLFLCLIGGGNRWVFTF